MNGVEKLKSFIDSKDLNEIISFIYEQTQKQLKVKIGLQQIPDDLEYIVNLVATARFNKYQQEGYSSYSASDMSITFCDDDFEPFLKDIESWKINNKVIKNSWSFL